MVGGGGGVSGRHPLTLLTEVFTDLNAYVMLCRI